MVISQTRPVSPRPQRRMRRNRRRRRLPQIIRTTDHKTIGLLYFLFAFGFFLIAGILAMLMRAELARPGLQFLSNEQYNQLFTIHGTLMMFLFATPMVFAFGNYLVPIQIGSPDIAFPRLNALSLWAFLFGGLLVVGGFFSAVGRRRFRVVCLCPAQQQHLFSQPGSRSLDSGAGSLRESRRR